METVSRRTRGRLDAYYRNLHRTIKNPTNNKVEEKINNNIIDHDEVEDDVVVDSESESESDDEEQHKKKKKKKKKKTKTRLVGKKRVGGGAAGEIDFFSVLDIDIEREKKRKIKRENSSIIIGEDGDRGLALKFKFDDDDDDDEGKSSASCLVGEKSEIDRLFDDLELGLWESSEAPLSLSQSSHSHSDYSCATVLNDEEETVEEEEEEEEVEVEESRAGKCSRGEHLPYVDEEIGIICTSCLSLLLDIKYVLPPFCAEPSASASPSKLTPSSSSSSSSNIPSSFKQVKQVEGGGGVGGVGGRESGGGTVFDLIPPSDKDKDKELYPHQLEGFELLWRNIGGGIHLNNLPASNGGGSGSGCIISHAPGTGKTRLTIVFLQTFLKLHPTCRPLLIAPRGMLLTWHQELIKWNAPISFHNLNESTLSHDEEETALALDQHYHHPYPKTLDYIRSIKIRSWIKGGSILGVAYRLFEELTRSHTFQKVLLDSPTLLILDEGHTRRNDHTLMWKVLTKVTTQRRIILSGTPFQNNFDELFNTLSLVNPTFSQQLQTQIGGGEASCRKRGRRRKNNNNAAREEWANLTNSITRGRGRGRASSRNDDEGIKKLRALIQPFVHIHKGNILHQTLPGMKDCLIILKPTPLQQKLLDHNVARLHNFLEQSHLASLISVHPSLVAQDPAFSHHKRKLKSLESDPKAGVKTHFLINLIDISSRINEKVLIFSEFIKPLLHIKKLLKSHFAYNEGRQVMYIDGDLSMKQRQSLITSFNDKNGEAKVLLASQRACCEGISLVGASRVVLLDVSWNPSVERQAICRAYRLGQEKMVYVYHLITLMEVKKYARQTEKDRISELIFSGAGAGEGEGEMRGCCRESVCQDKVLEAMVDRQGTMFERIVHQPKESDFIKDFGFGDLDFSTSMDFNDT